MNTSQLRPAARPAPTAMALLCATLAFAPAWSLAQQAPPGGPPPPVRASKDIAYSAELTVSDGQYQPQQSQAAASLGGKIGASASGIQLRSSSANRNGLIVHGGAPFSLADSSITLSGNGSNDFEAIAAGALVDAGGSLVLKSVHITTSGVLSAATAAREGAVLKVYDSTLTAHGGTLPADYTPRIGPGMMEPPAPLGIRGTARAHLSTSRSRTYFYHSRIIADGWGALSTDDTGGDVYLEANDSEIITRNSGYGVYADFGATVVLNRSRMDAATFGGIIAGAGIIRFNQLDGQSGVNTVMIHSVMGDPQERALLTITGGRLRSGQAALLVKSANADVTIDGAQLLPQDGVLVRSIVNPDPYATKVGEQSVPGIHVTLRNAELRGDVLHQDGQRGMTLTLNHARLHGAIQDAVLELDAASHWTASADSRLTLAGTPDLARLEAPAGVTIRATAAALRAGDYALTGGGRLVVVALDVAPLIQAVDRNHDGCMDHAEWRGAGLPESAYAILKDGKGCVTLAAMNTNPAPDGIDLNGDGKLTVEEFRAFDKKMSGARAAPAASAQPSPR